MKILLENLGFEGRHGITPKEKLSPQRFRVDVEIELWYERVAKDNLQETVDYREVRDIIQNLIQESSHQLLEGLAQDVATRIVIKNGKVLSATVTIRKLDIWNNGLPAVSFTAYASPPLDLLDFDYSWLTKELLRRGGASFPILPEKRRSVLLEEAGNYNYIKQPEIVGPAKVREQLSSFDKLPSESLFRKLGDNFTELLNFKIATSQLNPFSAPFNFNELVLQKYDRGSIGITPHMDNLSCINLINVFLLKGRGDLAICDDRQGSNPYYLDTTLGNVVIMRAPGFFGSNKRPFHFLANITEERITFGLRQKVKNVKKL